MKTAPYIPPSSIWKNDLEEFGKGQVRVLIGQFLKEGLSLVRQFCSIFNMRLPLRVVIDSPWSKKMNFSTEHCYLLFLLISSFLIIFENLYKV